MTYVSTVLADGAVGFWKLAEASGTVATDGLGDPPGFDGTYTGTGVTLAQTGIPGGAGDTAAKFDSAGSGYMDTQIRAGAVTGDVFTIEFWVKLTAAGTKNVLYWHHTASNNVYMVLDSSANILIVAQGVAVISTSTSPIPDTTNFHHVVWTKNGSTNKIYLDGTDVTGSVSDVTFGNSTGHRQINANGSGAGSTDCTMAMVAVYPTALSGATVAAHYSLGASSGAPLNTVAPAVTGTTEVGQTLTTTDGTWTDDGSPTFTYQWQRDTGGNLSFGDIGGATASTHALVSADLGNKVRCRVTDTDTGGATTANSNAVGLITAAPLEQSVGAVPI